MECVLLIIVWILASLFVMYMVAPVSVKAMLGLPHYIFLGSGTKVDVNKCTELVTDWGFYYYLAPNGFVLCVCEDGGLHRQWSSFEAFLESRHATDRLKEKMGIEIKEIT